MSREPSEVTAAGNCALILDVNCSGVPVPSAACRKTLGTPVVVAIVFRLIYASDAGMLTALSEAMGGGAVQILGNPLNAFIGLMRPLGLVDVARTGVAAIARGPEPI